MGKRTLVLLGDSILDNAPYTAPEPDTTAHLERLLGPQWAVRRIARDGATMRDVSRQLAEMKERPSIAVLSVGGNDAMEHVELLERPATSTGEVLEDLLAVAEAFGHEYGLIAKAVAQRAERTVLCTIYEVQLEPAIFALRARVPLALLNDRILGAAAGIGADVLELRSVCTEVADFVRQIEPSPQGAAKIAQAIAAVVTGNDGLRSGRVFAA